MKRTVKSLLGRAAVASGVHRRLLGEAAVIALFHRVADDLPPNPITCGVAEFRRFCALARSHFSVISMEALLDRLEAGEPVAGSMVINFDDGYRDNAEVAAPILTEHGLPATFFVATDLVESDRVPWWDEAWGIESRWMSWEQVRGLRSAGFEVGAHTRTHADLGEVEGTAAVDEIVGSRDRLEDELGEPVTLFSYPFGRPHQISEENRRVVRDAGFRCCPSAYGGLVHPGDDPFRLERQPYSPWHRTPWQFAWEVAWEARTASRARPEGRRRPGVVVDG